VPPAAPGQPPQRARQPRARRGGAATAEKAKGDDDADEQLEDRMDTVALKDLYKLLLGRGPAGPSQSKDDWLLEKIHEHIGKPAPPPPPGCPDSSLLVDSQFRHKLSPNLCKDMQYLHTFFGRFRDEFGGLFFFIFLVFLDLFFERFREF
jgi:hypothetical protein